MATDFSIEAIRRVAAGQCGRISQGQLKDAGLTAHQIQDWWRANRLIRRLPRVYALGSVPDGYEGQLWDAILYAGPGAMLSHLTAAAWRALIHYAPQIIHVTTPRKVRQIPGVRIHAQRPLPRELFRGLPVTLLPQTMLDLAAEARRETLVPHALAQLEYRSELDFGALTQITGKGRVGSVVLCDALAAHDPNLARLGGRWEEVFYAELVRRGVVPLPQLNVTIVDGITVDAVWLGLKLIVEIDDYANHHTAHQLARDAHRDMICRTLGFVVVRYRDVQLKDDIDTVMTELAALLARLQLAA